MANVPLPLSGIKVHMLLPFFKVGLPLGPKLLHYITLFFQINFPDYVIIFYITELVSSYFLGDIISCVVTKHTMWAMDYIT